MAPILPYFLSSHAGQNALQQSCKASSKFCTVQSYVGLVKGVICFTRPLFFSPCRMFRLRTLSAVSVGLVQLSRRHHSGAALPSARRRLMLAALAGVTGVSASAGLLWKR